LGVLPRCTAGPFRTFIQAVYVLSWTSFVVSTSGWLPAQETTSMNQFQSDSDHDGMSDALEQTLLVQFAPRFVVGRQDCSGVPAEFRPDVRTPEVQAET